MDQLKPLFAKALQTLECGACVAALVGAKDLAWFNHNWVLDAANDLCKDLKLMDADVVRIAGRSHFSLIDFRSLLSAGGLKNKHLPLIRFIR